MGAPNTHAFPTSSVRVNGRIRAREVRVIATDGSQLGILTLTEALTMARAQGVDLVEVAPNATPPVCRLVDYGKFRYEQSKKDKESKKHQHANKVKEIQLSATISANDFGVKLTHAIDFLCDEMKVKLTLKFRGREMAHQEYGFLVVQKFIAELIPFGHADSTPKLIGRGINVMLSPLPRNKRAKNPHSGATTSPAPASASGMASAAADKSPMIKQDGEPQATPDLDASSVPGGFTNNPFAALDAKASP